MKTDIKAIEQRHIKQLREHLQRHREESGRGDSPHFMPFEPGSPEGPKGIDEKALTAPLCSPGWQRWWAASVDKEIVGHVSLKGGGLQTGLHRCELGIGIESLYRGTGIGRALLQRAIEFAQKTDSLSWIDLLVFAHNTSAIHLYRNAGFTDTGVIRDRFRIGGQAIDDVIMVLPVGA
ncbi:MAG: GNAT family N-acetyltransferase [Desulfobacteraceae bacterium]|nr:GNAT family N-acetyltransferase [Desulfobacteraceae bacterium]